MRDKPGFERAAKSSFQSTEYDAGGTAISRNVNAISGAIHQITIANSSLFGAGSVVLQKFERKDSVDFLGALRFDGEIVFLNHTHRVMIVLKLDYASSGAGTYPEGLV